MTPPSTEIFSASPEFAIFLGSGLSTYVFHEKNDKITKLLSDTGMYEGLGQVLTVDTHKSLNQIDKKKSNFTQ